MLIGIVAHTAGNYYGVPIPYAAAFNRYGDILPVPPNMDAASPEFNTIVNLVDLLVLPGGMDVRPDQYGMIPTFECGNVDVHFDYFDQYLLPRFIEAKTPIIGICRGFQALNVAFGGQLTQHLDYHPTSTYRSERIHNVETVGGKKVKVNSLHHQGVLEEQLAPDLKRVAWHYNVVEAFVHRDLPIRAVQWQPEELPPLWLPIPIYNILLNAEK